MKIAACLVLGVLLQTLSLRAGPTTNGAVRPDRPRPTMGQFMGLNVHTVQFKPELYGPVCRLLRDYHPMGWDIAEDPTRATRFPMAANGVDWDALYGGWTRAGYEVDACLMFDNIPAAAWHDPAANGRAYGEAFARAFGPSSKHPFVTSAEVGNEPAKYSAQQYRAIFQSMAGGLRAGDPKLTVVTCAVMTGTPDQWSKPMSAIAGLESLYDVINVHSYPFKEGWPTWRRSYPEDPSTRFLKAIEDVVHWRDAHAPGKQVWLTEFGYDSASHAPAADGPWKQWQGVSDVQQATYLVRAFLVLSAMPIDRAYLYFFNDKDEAQLHGASGITRNFKPKPAFYAVAHLYQTLGDYRFVRAVARDRKLYCFEYQDARDPRERIVVAWSPTEGQPDSARKLSLDLGEAKVYRAQRMPMSADAPKPVAWKQSGGEVELTISEKPTYILVR